MNPKLKTSSTYQTISFIKLLGFVYVLMYGLILTTLLVTSDTKEALFTVRGFGITPFFALTSSSRVVFMDDFNLCIQHGMTRKMIFKSFLCKFVVGALFMALVETIMTYILNTNFGYQHLFQRTYGDSHTVVIFFLWLFALYFMCLLIIYIFANISSRVSKVTSILITTGVLTLILISNPNFLFGGVLSQERNSLFIKMLGFVDGQINFIYPIGTMIISSVIAMIVFYQLTKRTEIIFTQDGKKM